MFLQTAFRTAMALAVLGLFAGCTLGVITGTDGGGGTDTSATLTWGAPTTNADGTPLTDLAGYKVYQGTSSGVYGSTAIDVRNVLTHQVTGLPQGLHCFVVTAYDTSANESSRSTEACKTIQ